MAKRESVVHEPYDKFKGWLKEHRITYADLAELLGINETTVASKINGQSDFLLSEIGIIKSKYNLGSEIFFTNSVA